MVCISLFLNALVITITNVIPETLRLATAASLVTLAGVSLWAIGEYAIRSLTLATPAGIVAAYESRITGDRYLSEVRNVRESRRVDENPLRGFHEFLCSLIEDNSSSSWSRGINVMTIKVFDITRFSLERLLGEPEKTQTVDRSQTDELPLLQSKDEFVEGDRSEAGQLQYSRELLNLSENEELTGRELFHPPLVEFIPALALKADQSGATDEAKECLRLLKSTHKLGLQFGSEDAVRLSHEGFRVVFDGDSNHMISEETELTGWYFALIELRETAKFDSESHHRYLSEQLEAYRKLLENDRKKQFYSQYSVLSAAVIVTNRILSDAIQTSPGDLDAEIRDLWNIDLSSYNARTALIVTGFRMLCSLTELAVTNIDDGRSHVSPTLLRRTWENVARTANSYERGLSVPFYRGLIEAGYVISVVVDSQHSGSQTEKWQNTISKAHSATPSPVEEAFSRVYPQDDNERRRTATLPQPLLRLSEFKPVREHELADRILPKLDPTQETNERQPLR
ncbi:hypothetical protein [Halosimplex marinum]|uniref:hypothetical protein n=1 Tax=Halosimplex marinum TaxID=3396620 RepID=UPI003F5582BC